MPLAPVLGILSVNQRAIWAELAFTRAVGLVLYGGTAIALRTGHRVTSSLTFLSDRPLDQKAIINGPQFMQHSEVVQNDLNTIRVEVRAYSAIGSSSVVRLSYVGGVSRGRVGDPDPTVDGVLELASPIDLLATKLAMLTDRMDGRDYRDIAALLDLGVDLGQGLAAANALSGNAFSPMEVLKTATCFQGFGFHDLSLSDRSTLRRAVTSVRSISDGMTVSRALSGALP